MTGKPALGAYGISYSYPGAPAAAVRATGPIDIKALMRGSLSWRGN